MKQLLILTVCIFSASFLFAQEKQKPDREAIKQAQVKFFNQELQLSESEQAMFWPAYDKFREGMQELNGGGKGNRRKPRVELMSDAEAQAYIDDYFVKEEAKLALRKTLYDSLKAKMNVRKLAILPQTEQKFKRQLLHKARENRGLRGAARQNKRR